MDRETRKRLTESTIEHGVEQCDRCGEAVKKSNSSFLLGLWAGVGVLAMGSDRHIYKTERCAGSPSRRINIKNGYLFRAGYLSYDEAKKEIEKYKYIGDVK